ncbi:hypothetical protein [Spiroplasma sp. DGKH1]|uniref:hypothetical protein n=1 Tax=Spiroplasma sp. DGKH1 TaxID=3050074 RepID=UPI0034C5C980
MGNLFVDGYQGLCSRCCNNVKKVLINLRLNNPSFNLQNLKLINFNAPILKQQPKNFGEPLAIFYCDKIICGLFIIKNHAQHIANNISHPLKVPHQPINNSKESHRDPVLKPPSLTVSSKFNKIDFGSNPISPKKQYKKWVVIWILVVILILAASGGIVWWLFFQPTKIGITNNPVITLQEYSTFQQEVWGITSDRQNNLYVLTKDSKIWKNNKTNKFNTFLDINNIGALGINQDDKLFIVNHTTNNNLDEIWNYDLQDLTHKTKVSNFADKVINFVLTKNKNIYLSDLGHKVWTINPNNSSLDLVTQFSDTFGINYIVVDDNANVYIASGQGNLFKKGPGTQPQALGTLTGISALNIDANNHLYVATNSKELYVGDTNANFKPLAKLSENINLIVLDHQNHWYGASAQGNIWMGDLSGTVTKIASLNYPDPQIFIDQKNNVYVYSKSTNKIWHNVVEK